MNGITNYLFGSRPLEVELQDVAKSPKKALPLRSEADHKGNLIYAAEIFSLATTDIVSSFAEGWFSAGLNLLTGIGMALYGGKGLVTNITKLRAELLKTNPNNFVLFISAFKTIAYATWVLTGLGSVAYGISFFVPHGLEILQPVIQALPYVNVFAACSLVLMKLIDLYGLYHAEKIDQKAINLKWLALQSSLAILIAAVIYSLSDTLAPGTTVGWILICALYSIACDFFKRMPPPPLAHLLS